MAPGGGVMTLTWRIRLLLLGFFALLCVNAVLGLSNVIQRDAAMRQAADFQQARNFTNLLLTSVVEQETSIRGYVITGDEGLRTDARLRFGTAVNQWAERLSGMLTPAPTPDVQVRLEAVQDMLEPWQAHAVRELEAASDPDRAASLVAEGLQPSEDLRTQIVLLRDALQRAERAMDARVEETGRRLIGVLFASFLTGAGLLVVAGWLLRRWITQPLARMSAAVREVADGALTTSVPDVGPVDVAMLGSDIERMRRRIIDELEGTVRAKEALQQHGPAVVSLHTALAPVFPELPESVRVAAHLLPAEGQLAGDWYDLVPLERGKVALVVVDVSGHGAEAGVLALRAKQLLLASLRDGRSPGGTLDWVAANLGETGEMFLTAAVVEVNPALRRCRYANAGHPPLLLATAEGVTELPPTGPLLGPLATGWATAEAELEPGAVLVVYTDGLVEARDERGRQFGTERLISLVVRHRVQGPKRLANACVDAVRATANGRLTDDCTIVALALE